MSTSPEARKFKIYVDELKLAHTRHWDLDYLSRADLDALMTQKDPLGRTPDTAREKPEPKP